MNPLRLLVLLGLLGLSAFAADKAEPRGGRVGWARLVTESASWTVHRDNDQDLAVFIREQTSLNIDPTFYSADATELDSLCGYPLIFTNNLTNIRSTSRIDNVREYLRRGGFIYIDRCVNLSFSLEQETFYERHLAFFAKLLPGCQVRELPSNHQIYRCYFNVKSAVSPTENNHCGIYGVYDGGRMVALLGLSNFLCGWPNAPDRRIRGQQMVANIYVYAMTRGQGDGPAQ